MRQLEVENQLRDVVSRIIVQVELATSQGRTDINLALEDAFIPILKSVCNLPHLVNLNRKQKNFPGIDLGDDHDRVAFQITSTTTLEKVKFTVQQFMDRAYYNTFDELFILMLGKKQSSYSQASVNELLTDQFAFNCKKHIIDLGDILGQVTALRLAAQERVLSEFTKNTRSETAKKRASTNIVRDLLVCISNKTYEDLLREKLRGAPIEMKVNAALHLRVRILEIVSKPRDTRKCVSRRRIQIGVASASIDGAMTETEVRDAIWIIGADGDVSGCVGHEVMNA